MNVCSKLEIKNSQEDNRTLVIELRQIVEHILLGSVLRIHGPVSVLIVHSCRTPSSFTCHG